MKKVAIFSLIVFIIDQIVKLIVSFNLDLNSSIAIIDDFYISNVRNYGAAFSILYGNRLLLVVVSIIALFIIYRYLIKGNCNRKIDILFIRYLWWNFG